MLLYTDGGDTRSAISFDELLESAEGVRRHGLRHRRARSSVGVRPDTSSSMVLQQIAEVTGGQAFFPPSARSSTASTSR